MHIVAALATSSKINALALLDIYMHPMYKYMSNWCRLFYLDSNYLITETEYMFTSM